jgi:BirA family biotin operon repressor/biotin-[acetyl-CoA-carboxylase] ligase
MTTLFIGQNHIKLREVDSTNDYAAILMKSGNPMEGTLVSAANQTKGKGQRGKLWLSESGSNLILSIILYPAFLSADRQFELNKAISFGVATFIAHYVTSKKVSIKWPNDIYVGDNKIAGILIENTVRNNNIQSSIIGIGCNINQDNFEKSIPNPTSLKLETGDDYSISDCIKSICSFIEAKYLDLRNNHSTFSSDAYNNLLYRKNEMSLFEKPDGTQISGIIRGVDKNGRLIIENENGEKIFFRNGEISMLITRT